MAKKSMILKQQREPKFSSRRYNRCKICGRPHAYLRDYGICRICFRELAYKGQIPGVKKASWYTKAKLLRPHHFPEASWSLYGTQVETHGCVSRFFRAPQGHND